MKEAIAKLDAERENFWHEIGLEMQRAFEESQTWNISTYGTKTEPSR
jgi:hypothetical protein